MNYALLILQEVHKQLLKWGFEYQKPESYVKDNEIIKVLIDNNSIRLEHGSSKKNII